jgi:NTE family protein
MGRRSLGLALGGGGALGMAHVGVLEYLEQRHIRPDLVVGSSIGAIIGGLYALDPDVGKLRTRIRAILEDKSLGGKIGNLAHEPDVSGVTHTKELAQFIQKQLAGIKLLNTISLRPREDLSTIIDALFGNAQIEDAKTPFAAVVLDILSGEELALREGSMAEAVYASAAIPGIFPPQLREKRELVDGGFTSSCPVHFARHLGADVVVAVPINRILISCRASRTGIEVMTRTDEIARHKLAKVEIESADLIISPKSSDSHWGDFSSWESVAARGLEAAEAAAPDLDRLVQVCRGNIWSRLISHLKL